MTNLRIYLFGKTKIQCGPVFIENLPAKAYELFCFLLLHRKRPFTREVLANHLWDDISAAKGKKYLRDTLWRLQSELESQIGLQLDTLLIMENEWVYVHPQADIWVDVHSFEEALAVASGVKEFGLNDEQMHRLADAVSLYQGDLMEGWYQDWCILERERLQILFLTSLDRLMVCYEVRRQFEEGIICGLAGLHYDWARERTHRRLMRLYYLAGDRTAALRQYDRCRNVLKEEFDVQPEPRTTALYEQIRSGQPIDRGVSTPQQSATLPQIIALLPNILDELHTLQLLLNKIK